VSAGTNHTCAILDNGNVLCFGSGANGRLGYGGTDSVGDNETPASVGPVDLGTGRVATAISASDVHTCAALDNGTMLCWGNGASGKLGYSATADIGDDVGETPGSVGAISLGGALTAYSGTASIADATKAEGDVGSSNVTLTVTLTAAAPWPVSFAYATADDSATDGDDYTGTPSGTVTVNAGATTGAFTVPVLGDTDDEPDETFDVTISSPTPVVGITDATATVTITDDDLPPTTTTTTTTTTLPTTTTSGPATTTTVPAPSDGDVVGGGVGYWMLETDGTVYAFGSAEYYGDVRGRLNGSVAVDLDATPSGSGYWILARDGVVYAFGDAVIHAPTRPLAADLAPGEHAVAILSTLDGGGYWISTNRGRVATYGDAIYSGDASELPLNGPIVDAARAETGEGYYLAASDGGVFAFGSAQFRGSMGAGRIGGRVSAFAPDADGRGYRLVSSDGGVFCFSARFFGSLKRVVINREPTGMATAGNGYVVVGGDGGVFSFGDANFFGGLGANPPDTDIVTIVPAPTS
jgi:hypothetical protein